MNNKHHEIDSSKLGLFLSVLFILTSCTNNEVDINQENILGVWISLDKRDTLDFASKIDFYRSTYHMHDDHYDYKLMNDSIEIGYRGKMYIDVQPSIHKYSVENTSLTIDFSNKTCFGFDSKIITYHK